MRGIVNKLVKTYLEYRYRKISDFMNNPIQTQQDILMNMLFRAQDTVFGKRYGFNSIADYRTFADRVPLQDYEDTKADIYRMIRGETDVLWPGKVSWFSKSSGTTSDKSKFIPVSDENLKNCHIKGSWDSVAILYQKMPDARVFADKSLIMGGSLSTFDENPEAHYGDVSAIMLHNMPFIGRPFYAPDFETALMDNWEEKISKMARIVKDENITMFGGVPTWTMVLLDKILELTGETDMSKVWPNAKIYMHGGVNFKPYYAQFSKYFSATDFLYQEVYNASEGFFSVQHDNDDDDMVLLLENGVFYEFLPYENMQPTGAPVPLQGVEVGKKYALIISTNAGLWRYLPGDVVEVTSTFPYKIKITGRTKQFINVFGEEVMVANTDEALARACKTHNAIVSDYSVAPRFLEQGNQGGHEWIIEFDRAPRDMAAFSITLDTNLQAVNSDYEAKRAHDLALTSLTLRPVPNGTFHAWLKSKNKLGGQHKVPRLHNSRKYVDEILEFIQSA